MPSDDLILNVRQIAGYPAAAPTSPTDAILIQQGGLGGPYASISPATLVSNALAQGGDMRVSGTLSAFEIEGGTVAFANGTINALLASSANIINLHLAGGDISGDPLATQGFVQNTTVSSFNFRRGDVVLDIADIKNAGGAPIHSPVFEGVPLAPTPLLTSNDNQLATTAFVQMGIASYIGYLLQTQPFVFSWNGRSGDVVLTMEDLVGADGALIDSPAFIGNPTAPTPPPGDVSQSIATTQFVSQAIATNNTAQNGMIAATYAPLDSPAFFGVPTGPTAPAGNNSGQLATTSFVMNALQSSVAGVSTWNGRGGNVTMTSADITTAGGALLASPALSGVPTGPTAAVGTNTTQLATTAFVLSEIGGAAGVASFNGRSGIVVLNTADITGAGGAPTNSPSFSGTPSAPTATAGTNTTQIATTAFVTGAIASATVGVSSFNGRTGAVTLQASDLSAAGAIANPSPALTGAPTSTTPSTGTNNTQIATTAFVNAEIAQNAVTTFNGRSGAVTLTTADITGAGGAPLANPAFTGVPTAATATSGTSTTQLATTAFVMAAISGAVGPIPSTVVPLMNGVAALGTDAGWARGDHVHPTDTTRVPLAGGVTIAGTLQINGMLTSNSFQGVGPFALTALPTTNPGSNQVWNSGGALVIGASAGFVPTTGGPVNGPVDLKVQPVTAAATTAINRANGENVTLTLGVSITALNITGWPASGWTGKLRLVIVSSGAFTIAWPAGTKWAGGAPTLTSSGTDIVLLMTDNAGATIYGSVVGQAYA